MAQLILNIPDNQINRVIDAICIKYGYQDQLETPEGYIPNPLTKAQFSRNRVAELLKNHILQIEREIATNAISINNVDVI